MQGDGGRPVGLARVTVGSVQRHPPTPVAAVRGPQAPSPVADGSQGRSLDPGGACKGGGMPQTLASLPPLAWPGPAACCGSQARMVRCPACPIAQPQSSGNRGPAGQDGGHGRLPAAAEPAPRRGRQSVRRLRQGGGRGPEEQGAGLHATQLSRQAPDGPPRAWASACADPRGGWQPLGAPPALQRVPQDRRHGWAAAATAAATGASPRAAAGQRRPAWARQRQHSSGGRHGGPVEAPPLKTLPPSSAARRRLPPVPCAAGVGRARVH